MSVPETSFDTGKRLQAQGELVGAEAAYREALAQEPGSFRALNNLGTVLEDQDRLKEAEEVLRRARELAPDAFPVLFNFGRVLHLRGNLAEACDVYREARNVSPESWKALFNLGQVLLDAGRLEEAELVLQEATLLDPESLKTRSSLGDSLFHQGKVSRALEQFKAAAELDPDEGIVQFNLAKALTALRRDGDAEPHLRRAIRISPRSESAWVLLEQVLQRQGKTREARELLEEWLAQQPSNATARHLLAAMTGEAPLRASDDYVQNTFDGFADSFDHTLRNLNYRGPELIGRTVKSLFPNAESRVRILDAGCGTGLCAPHLRPWASRLVGVDLSGNMIEKARQRGGYDDLHRAELTAFLRDHPLAFDVIAAADTLIYFGDLTELLTEAAGALTPQGWFIFTVEALEDTGDAGYRLLSSGRYAHAERYLREQARQAGFRVAKLSREVIRTETGQPVGSLILALQLAAKADAPAGRQSREATRDRSEDAESPFREASLLHVSGDDAGAIEAYRRTVALDPTHFRAWNNLGTLLESRLELDEAARCYRESARHAPGEAPPRYNLGHALQRQGRLEAAIAAYRETLDLNPAHEAASANLARALLETGRSDEAGALLRDWLKRSPDQPTAKHLLGVAGEIPMPRASREYVRSLFDGFAEDFEHSLSALSYRAPELVGDLFDQIAPREPEWDVLDAGCGTGLCAPRLRPRSRKLVGVDLSAKMLSRAAAREIYDELIEEDLETYCAGATSRFHAVVAADTFNYFGDLTPLLRGLRDLLHPGGVMVFTLEAQDSPGYLLHPHGRYSHGESTVRTLLESTGFQLRSLDAHILRQEGDDPVRGFLVSAVLPS